MKYFLLSILVYLLYKNIFGRKQIEQKNTFSNSKTQKASPDRSNIDYIDYEDITDEKK
jgi:hypothetical protein